jgi:hypothetical protein
MLSLFRRQANEVAQALAKVALFLASFHLFIDIPTCIQDNYNEWDELNFLL